jgi:hypothetical protein
MGLTVSNGKNFISFEHSEGSEVLNMNFVRSVGSTGMMSMLCRTDSWEVEYLFDSKELRDNVIEAIKSKFTDLSIPPKENVMMVNNQAFALESSKHLT